MKKIIYIMLIIIFFNLYISYDKNIYLPKDTLRFRIIANSNNEADQAIKMNIKKDIETNIFELIKNSKSKEETRKIINDNYDKIEKSLNKYNIKYDINYGYNHFPSKEYKGVIYEEGDYESLVISLGEAKGNNWWCVMYPPLCLLENESNKYEEPEYKLYVKEIISKLTS